MKKYEFVANSLSEEIRNGGLASGDFLPTEERLTQMYGVSRQTVRKALSVLEENDIIEKSRAAVP